MALAGLAYKATQNADRERERTKGINKSLLHSCAFPTVDRCHVPWPVNLPVRDRLNRFSGAIQYDQATSLGLNYYAHHEEGAQCRPKPAHSSRRWVHTSGGGQGFLTFRTRRQTQVCCCWKAGVQGQRRGQPIELEAMCCADSAETGNRFRRWFPDIVRGTSRAFYATCKHAHPACVSESDYCSPTHA